MADNKFSNLNDDFEDIFSNAGKSDKYEDIYSSSGISDDEFEDISSGNTNDDFSKEVEQAFQVKYNTAVENRRRQEIQYNDINDVYGDLAKEEQKKEKKRHPIRNTIITILCITIVGLSCVGIFGYQKINSLLSSFDTNEQLTDNAFVNAADLTQYPDQINVLLVGVDAREGDTASRSDTMMLVTLDNKNKQIKLTSFLRDSFVEIAGKNYWSKLNSAYFQGGIQTLSDTLELNFKVDIQYYALVDFEIFTTIVDSIGGINVDVTEKESYYTYHSGKVNVPVRIEAGEDVLLNGEQALWYSRIRYLDSDFHRTERQRKVITAIVEKASTMSLTELYSLAEKIIPLVKTNMSSNQIMSLGLAAVKDKVYSYPIVQHQIPADGTWSDKTIEGVGASLVMDMEQNQQLLHSFLSEKQEIPTENTSN
ncbi:MAG: LCP family protein [Clostridia bacterium]|nr:LCP family protein [Clostridia bacterium]